MADQFIQVPPNSTGLKVDTTELTVGANTVERERINVSDPSDAAGFAKVENTTPGASDYGLVTRNIPSGTQVVSGTVTANVGTTNGLALDATVSAVQPRRIQDGTTGTLAVVTAGNALKVDGSGVTQPVSGTVTANQGGTWTVQPGNTANTTAWKVDGSAVTQPVSGTVTANAGTNLNTSALALDASVTGLEVTQGSTTSGQKGILDLGAVTTAAPSYTTAQTSPLSLTTAGALRVDGSAVTQPVSGTVTTTPPSNASTNVAQFGGTNVSTGTGTGGAGIPRVTVSSDSFPATQAVSGTVTANQGGTWTVQPGNTANTTAWKVDGSAVTQPVSGTVTTTPPANASTNVTQFGSTNVATGTGAGGAGIPRVTVSNDSNILATQSGTWNVGVTGTAAAKDAADGTPGTTAPTTAQQMGGTDTVNLRALSVDPSGAVIISPSSSIQELLYSLILETRATRMAILAMTTGGGSINYSDFDVSSFQDQISN